jgi:hypothetical protein
MFQEGFPNKLLAISYSEIRVGAVPVYFFCWSIWTRGGMYGHYAFYDENISVERARNSDDQCMMAMRYARIIER